MHRFKIPATVFLFSLLLLLLAGLLGCVPLGFSGASRPVEHTFHLTDADLAEAADLSCEQDWFTGDASVDVPAAFDRLTLASIRVVYRNPIAGGTAGQSTLYLRKNFHERSPEAQARLLLHELTHYCDRKRLGDAVFERRFQHSAGRYVLEMRAKVQQLRGFQRQGATEAQLRTWAEREASTFRDTYWLWDIDPEQYERETTRILLAGVGL
jgi:hypothetical protein